MEKLIKLFNEFMEKEKNFTDERELITNIFEEDLGGDDGTVLWAFMQNPDKGYAQYSYPEWTSKKFGFIKWLVENEKIDNDKIKENGGYVKMSRLIWDGSKDDVKKYWEYRILMILSIQDEPIEFLVSILK